MNCITNHINICELKRFKYYIYASVQRRQCARTFKEWFQRSDTIDTLKPTIKRSIKIHLSNDENVNLTVQENVCEFGGF